MSRRQLPGVDSPARTLDLVSPGHVNPGHAQVRIRAGITDSLEGSRYTSIVKRIEALAAKPLREPESLGALPSIQLSLGESLVTTAGRLSKGLGALAGEAVASASDAARTDSQTVAGLPAAPGRTSQLSESAARECNKASEIPFDALRAILG